MASSTIPINFISDRFHLRWADVLEGIMQGWLDRKDAIDLAVINVSSNRTDDPDAIELAGLLQDEEDKVATIVKCLADKEPVRSQNEVRLLWMRTILAWVYENRGSYDDPLAIVEGIYADFGYPEEIRNIVRYNEPTDGYRPQDHSEDENIERLMGLWQNYLESNVPLIDSI